MTREILLICTLAFTASAATVSAQGARSPIIYNRQGNEVGVIQRILPDGDAIVLPTEGTLGLGYYDVMMPAASFHPRARGGWLTTMSNDQIAYLEPVPRRFFMPSGM